MKIDEIKQLKEQGKELLAQKKFKESLNKFSTAYNLCIQEFNEQSQPALIGHAKWSMYEIIKSLVEMHENDKNKTNKGQIIKDLHNYLREYAKFEKLVEKYKNIPLSKQHNEMNISFIIREICKVAKEFEQFKKFIYWIDIKNLRHEDWEYSSYNKQKYPPLVAKIVRSLVKNINAFPNNSNNKDIQYILNLNEQVIKKLEPKDKLWLYWDRVELLKKMGDYKKSFESLNFVLKNKQTESWVWSKAAELFDLEQNTESAISCYCRALELGKEDKFLVKTHYQFAELLAREDDYKHASCEINIAIKIREENEWGIPNELHNLTEKDWYDIDSFNIKEQKDFYAQHSTQALELCFDQVEQIPATYIGCYSYKKQNPNHQKSKLKYVYEFSIQDTNNKNNYIVLKQNSACNNYKVGQAVNLIVGKNKEQKDYSILHTHTRDNGDEWDCTKIVYGKLKQKEGQNFAFIDNIFIPPDILKNKPNNTEQFKIAAVLKYNKKQDKDTWQAVAFI